MAAMFLGRIASVLEKQQQKEGKMELHVLCLLLLSLGKLAYQQRLLD